MYNKPVPNHRFFKYYHHSATYYEQLAKEIDMLKEQCKTVTYSQLPSTINRNRKSKFIKSNNNTNKLHKQVGWVQFETHTHSQSISCDSRYLYGIQQISC